MQYYFTPELRNCLMYFFHMCRYNNSDMFEVNKEEAGHSIVNDNLL